MSGGDWIDDLNLSWEGPIVGPGWEPWEDDEPEPDPPVGCHYCTSTQAREYPDPFGGKPCCDACFLILIDDEPDAEPWRCGNAPPTQGDDGGAT